MSIAVLTQVYDETRRLAIAGSNVAPGDFRLKKLIPPLEQAGAKAPVFAKVAQAVQGVVDSNEKTAPAALLELSSLVNAILYTQGETGCAGDLKPIETQDLGQQTTRTSARLLKPLLEALSQDGGGRVGIIEDAINRGLFSDLRLVRHALNALDDSYSGITEMVADRVLPQYGRAIVPELRAKLDLKGKKAGHLARLKLLHRIDPDGSRSLVEETLDKGSKEMKVVAIRCLGRSKEDLDYLLKQSQAAAADVREAALEALGRLDATSAMDTLEKAICGPDIRLAIAPLRENRHPRLLKFVLQQAEEESANLLRSKKDSDLVSKCADRLRSLLDCLSGRKDDATMAFVLKLFDQRAELKTIKGDPGGKDIVYRLEFLMSDGSPVAQKALVDTHAEMSSDDVKLAFATAVRCLKPTAVYDIFAPYLLAKVDDKKGKRDPAFARRESISQVIQSPYYAVGQIGNWRENLKWDPRWLETAVRIGDRSLVCELVRPDSAAAKKFLFEEFNALLSQSKGNDALNELYSILKAMVLIQHPKSVECMVATLDKFASGRSHYYYNWFAQLIYDLPKSAVPELEKVLPKLEGKAGDELANAILSLKVKPDESGF